MKEETKGWLVGGLIVCVGVGAIISFVLAILFLMSPIENSLKRWADYWHYESRAEEKKRLEQNEPRH